MIHTLRHTMVMGQEERPQGFMARETKFTRQPTI